MARVTVSSVAKHSVLNSTTETQALSYRQVQSNVKES